MKGKPRFIVFLVLIALVFALPYSVLANKRVYKANLSTANELHEVVGSTAKGSFVLSGNPDGSYHFLVNVRNLSSDTVNGMHIHGPATTAQNAPVIISLCGNPAPSALGGPCPVSGGVMSFEGNITSGLLASWGLSGGTFQGWLDDELTYVNVHTPLNPAGETRGQIIPR